jgi:hypothetical protein
VFLELDLHIIAGSRGVGGWGAGRASALRETADTTYGTSSSMSDLKSRVVEALKNHAIRTLREQQVSRHMSRDGADFGEDARPAAELA